MPGDAMAALLLLITCALLPALAAGSSAAPPPPPRIDFSGLPDSASHRRIQADGKPHPVLARLLLDQTTVAAGSTAQIGLHLEQDEDWHTYWRSPGEVGQPTEIQWEAPAGITITDHAYPVPQRFEQPSGDEVQVSFGYDGEVLLISELTVPGDAPEGEHLVSAQVSWLVCRTLCIQGGAELALPVQVVAAGTEAAASAYAPLFAHYRAQHPTPPEAVTTLRWHHALSVEQVPADGIFQAVFLIEAAQGATLPRIDDALWPTFTPIVATDYSWELTGPPRLKQLPDGRILVAMEGEGYEPEPLPTDAQIGGLIQLQIDGAWVRTELTRPVPFAAAGTTPTPTSAPLLALAAQHLPAGTAEAAQAPPDALPDPFADPDVAEASVAPGVESVTSLTLSLLFGFIGGLILNVMPCVLPVITLKLYGLVEQADVGQRERQAAGVAYSAGILASFWAMAAVVIALKLVFGVKVSWGFMFQYPPYVAALTTIVFVFSLSLFGVFELPALGVEAASNAASREGPVGYFMYGVLAVLLATPCSAPFLGSAIAYAFSAPPLELTLIFTSIGLGLASPFLVIAFVPVLFRFLPRPGPWMETFKQLVAFTLVGTAAWLAGILADLIGDGIGGFLAFLVFPSLGVWLFGHFGGLAGSGRQQLTSGALGLLLTAVGAALFLDLSYGEDDCDDGSVTTELSFDGHIPWQPFSEERVAALAGNTVFIDFTAEWCASCKVNERVVLETATVREAMAELGVVPLKADWTRPNEEIEAWLARFKREGVPMYVVLPAEADREPILLPEVITPQMVVAALQDADPS